MTPSNSNYGPGVQPPAQVLQDVLDALRPRIIRDYLMPLAMILEHRKAPAYIASSYAELLVILTGHVQAIMREWQGGRLLPAEAHAHARRIIENVDRSAGWIPTCKDAVLGRSAGLSGVLRILNEAILAQAEQHYIDYILDQQLDPLDYHTLLRIAAEFRERFGKIYLTEDELMTTEELAANFRSVLRHHLKTCKVHEQFLR